MPNIQKLINLVQQAKSNIEIRDIIKTHFIDAKQAKSVLPKNADSFTIDPTAKISMAKAKKLRVDANDAALAILDRVKGNPSALTEEDKAVLRKYSGLGGIGKTENEYFTPDFVASGIWDGLEAMGFSGGNVLEPSAGAGVFFGTKPPATEITGCELEEVQGTINQLLHPNDTVNIGAFEHFATKTPDNSFDHVIGNPPFGQRGSKENDDFRKADPDYIELDYADQYFVERSISLCKKGGLIALALPPRIVDNRSSKWQEWRKKLAYKAEFLGAHMLPNGTFRSQGTDTTVIVCFWRKFGDDVTETLTNTDSETLEKANVLFDEYIDGTYFEKSGRKYVQGELGTRKGMFNSIETTSKGVVNPSDIRNKLSKPFKSRIEWDLISESEPLTVKYTDGDCMMINGRFKTLINGQWLTQDVMGQKADQLDAKFYGVSSVKELEKLLASPYAFRTLNFEQATHCLKYFPAFFDDTKRGILEVAKKQKPKFREQVLKGSSTGLLLDSMNRSDGTMDTALRDEALNFALEDYNNFGYALDNRSLVGLTGSNTSYWNKASAILDKDGKASDLMSGDLTGYIKGKYNDQSTYSIIEHLFGYEQNKAISLNDINELYKGPDAPITMDKLIADDAIALTAEGCFAPIEEYLSGDAVMRSSQIAKTIAQLSKAKKRNATKIAKLQKQLSLLRSKRNWQSISDITGSLNSPWVDKKYILEFLQDKGYTEFKLGSLPNDINDNKAVNGGFWGYRFDEEGKKKTDKDEQFHRHLENYLNNQAVQTEKTNKTVIMNQMNALNEEFNWWMQTHHDVSSFEQSYNDKYCRFIQPKEDKTDLELKNTSGNISLMPYQNAAIRRMANDGKGLLGFTTGLGKTFTSLGLVSYLHQTGRKKRTAIVVPKSTYENWYHEQLEFNGRAQQKHVFFVGLEPEKDSNGEIIQVPILNNKGEDTGKTRDKVKMLSSNDITARMNSIPHSSYRTVVMTKEQFAAIPMRMSSKEKYVDSMVNNSQIVSQRLALDTVMGEDTSKSIKLKKGQKDGYLSARREKAYKNKYKNDGTTKQDGYPYYEEMLFDSIVIDEAHNYRNSYQVGRESAKLAWLPTSNSAKSALDMAMKLEYLRENNDGTGCYGLSATPVSNSVTDIYNMLSMIISPQEWIEKHNIANVDDFVRVFGQKEMRDIETISGEIVPMEALVGFQNLQGLRNIFHQYVNMKNADDVGADVVLPDVVECDAIAPMSQEQEDIYNDLKAQAKAAKDLTKEERQRDGLTAFSFIRKMDKIATDPDLYFNTMTYYFENESREKVETLVSKLPDTIKLKNSSGDKDADLNDDEQQEFLLIPHDAKISELDNKIVLVVHAAFEDKVNDLIGKVGIKQENVNHPITPKYAALIENVKNGLKQGKQIIFTEEKSQHQKLARILAHHLGFSLSQIGIINADSIVKGRIPPDEDNALEGLEAIAREFNEDRTPILIANKKAEVGINLHKGKQGCTDVHMLTISWTPASQKQKLGRAVRVGATAKSVRCWIYQADGSFDKFRYKTMKRKENWIEDILSQNNKNNTAANENADDMNYANDLLADNEEERQQNKADRQQALDIAKRAAEVTAATKQLEVYLNAAQAVALAKVDSYGKTDIDRQISNANYSIDEATKERNREKSNKTKKYKELSLTLRSQKDRIRRLERVKKAIPNAENQLKQLKNVISRYIENGILTIDSDAIDHPDKYVSVSGFNVKEGSIWKANVKERYYTQGFYGLNDTTSQDFDFLSNDTDEMTQQIIRITKNHAQLGFAECEIIQLDKGLRVQDSGFRGSKQYVHIDTQKTFVFYANLICETNYTSNNQLLADGLRKSLSTSKNYQVTDPLNINKKIDMKDMNLNLLNPIIDRLGASEVKRILNEENAFYQDVKGAYLLIDGEVVYKENKFNLDAEHSITPDEWKCFIYPCDLTDDIKAEVGKLVLSKIKEDGPLSGNRYDDIKRLGNTTTQVEMLLGTNWFSDLPSYGNRISSTEIYKIAETAVKEGFAEIPMLADEVIEENKNYNVGADRLSDYVIQKLRSFCTNLYQEKIGTSYDNVSEINTSFDSYFNGLSMKNEKCRQATNNAILKRNARISADKESHRQTLVSLFDAAKKDSKDKAKERLELLIDKQSEYFDVDSLIEYAGENIYKIDYEDNNADHLKFKDKVTLLLQADLENFTAHFTTVTTSNDEDIMFNALRSANKNISILRTLLKINGNVFEGGDSKYIEDGNGNIRIPDGVLSTMNIKRNQSKLVTSINGRETGNFEAGDIIGIHDPAGFGKLAKLLSERENKKSRKIKDKYQCKWHSSDNGDFAGGWWLFPKDTDLNEFNKEF